jgi:hypothetical protein
MKLLLEQGKKPCDMHVNVKMQDQFSTVVMMIFPSLDPQGMLAF